MYDELKQGFEHHFIQPCYMENDSVEENGKVLQWLKILSRNPRMASLITNTQMDGGRLMRAVMALSGGMDSTGLLIHLLSKDYKVSCISYEYGQKHNIEIERAKANIEYFSQKGYEIEHQNCRFIIGNGLISLSPDKRRN